MKEENTAALMSFILQFTGIIGLGTTLMMACAYWFFRPANEPVGSKSKTSSLRTMALLYHGCVVLVVVGTVIQVIDHFIGEDQPKTVISVNKAYLTECIYNLEYYPGTRDLEQCLASATTRTIVSKGDFTNAN